jgi:hypothetical protein
MCALLQKKP